LRLSSFPTTIAYRCPLGNEVHCRRHDGCYLHAVFSFFLKEMKMNNTDTIVPMPAAVADSGRIRLGSAFRLLPKAS